MNKIKISNFELVLTTSGFVFGSGPLFIASGITQIAGRDGWISAICATVIGLLTVWINTYLGGLYPDKTFIEVIDILLGKWLGTIISVLYSFITIVIGTQIVWYVGDLITTNYTPEISPYPINILFVASLVIALLYGLETMCRAITVYFMILFPLYITTLLMLIPNIKVDNILPIFENGISPVLKGTIPLLSLSVWPFIVLNMVFPSHLKDLKKAKHSMLYGYLLGMFIAVIGVLMCILVLGETITSNSRYPLFVLSREVNVGTIFSRIEGIVIAVWLTTNFISTFFFIYMGIKGISQILKLSDYKKIVIPFGLIIAVYSQFIYKNVPYQIRWDSETWPVLAFTAGAVFPVLLLLLFAIRKVMARGKKGTT